jgi:WhiB family redox-sensing transcriptional regulator
MGDWRDRAACGSLPPEDASRLFYPDGASLKYQDDIDASKAICAGCPVRVECLVYATIRKEEHGTWGGLTEWDRRGGRRKNGIKNRTTYTKICEYCNNEYETTQTVQKTCGRRCSSLLQSRERALVREEVAS